MLIERDLNVMNIDVVGRAYGIAAGCLRRTGALPDSLRTDEVLLEIVVRQVHAGDRNWIRIGNRAIALFGAARKL